MSNTLKYFMFNIPFDKLCLFILSLALLGIGVNFWDQWAFACGLLSVAFPYLFYRKFKCPVMWSIVQWVCLSVVYLVLFRENHFHTIGTNDILFERTSAIAFLKLIFLVTPFLFYKPSWDKPIENAIVLAIPIHSAFLLFDIHIIGAMEASMLAILLPFLSNARVLGIFPVSAIIYSQQHIAIGALIVSALVYLFLTRRIKLLLFSIYGLLCSLGFIVYRGINLFDDNERMPIWQMAWDYFIQMGNYISGIGVGTAYSVIPWLQLQHGEKHTWFTFLHSDWFTFLFEGGLVLLVLSVVLFIVSIYRSRKDPIICTALITYGAVMLFNFPLHIPATALVGIYLLVRSATMDRKGNYL